MRGFLLKCLESDIFADFFAQMDTELALAVESLFEEYFMPAFLGSGEEG